MKDDLWNLTDNQNYEEVEKNIDMLRSKCDGDFSLIDF